MRSSVVFESIHARDVTDFHLLVQGFRLRDFCLGLMHEVFGMLPTRAFPLEELGKVSAQQGIRV